MGYLTLFSIVLTSTLCYTTAYNPAECDFGETYYNIFKIGQHNCDCQAKSAGQLKFAEGKVLVCDGSEWKALQYEGEYGSRYKPGFSCDDIRAKSKQATNGVYWITLGGKIFLYSIILAKI